MIEERVRGLNFTEGFRCWADLLSRRYRFCKFYS